MKICNCIFCKRLMAYVLYSWILVHFELIFVTVLGRVQILYFCLWKSSCPTTICWRDYFFPTEWTWYSFQKSIGYRYMGLFIDFQLSIDLYVYPCACTTPFWLLQLCDKFVMSKCESSNFVLFSSLLWLLGLLATPWEF